MAIIVSMLTPAIAKREYVLPLIYSWHVHSDLRQTAPFIEVVSDSGP